MPKLANYAASALVGAMAVTLAGCTSSRAAEEQNYSCPVTPEQSSAITCGGLVAGLLLTPRLEPCDVLRDTFVPSSELDVTILPFTEYYDQGRIYAALSSHFNMVINVTIDNKRRSLYLRIPAGYMTDFTSNPKGLPQAFIRTFSKHIFPSLAHDFLYAVGPAKSGDDVEQGQNPENWYKRSLADDVIEAGLARNGSSWLTQATVKTATRLGGEKSFGAKEELKFFVRDATVGSRVVAPTAGWDPVLGHSETRLRYVKICDHHPKWDH